MEATSLPFPECTTPLPDRTAVFAGYLDYFRSVLVAKLDELTEGQLRESILPSGWAPIELLKHLTFVERRWLEWGFEGHTVGDPWGDQADGRWTVHPDETFAVLVAGLGAQATVTRSVLSAHALDEVGRPGARWDGEPEPTLERICFHLLQEYARHTGQLDVVVELLGGPVGE